MGGSTNRRWAYALVTLATLLWGSNFILGRLLRDDIGPFTLTAGRFTVAALMFLPLLRRVPAEQRRPGKQWPWLLGMGLAGLFGFTTLLYSGLRLTSATNAALINGTGPLIIGLLAAVLLGERYTRHNVAGALISMAGVAVIVSEGSLQRLLSQQLNAGDLLVLVAVVLWGIYSVLSRVATRTRSTLAVTILSTWMGLPWLYPAAAWEWHSRPPTLTLPVVLAVIYIGIFPSVVAYLAWNEGIRRVGAGRATVFYNMLPVFGALLGVILLGEPFGPAQAAGGGLVIAGSLISAWRDLRSPGGKRQHVIEWAAKEQ